MRIDIITCLPGLLESPLSHSILQRARDKQLLEVHVHDLRDYTTDRHRQIDDYVFGGSSGMLMMAEPIVRCIETLQRERAYDEIIFLSPEGETFHQGIANQLSLNQHLMLLCGHYKGVDQRVRDYFITREISIGDYVLSGGELPALVLTDALGRLIPGVLGDETSALTDSMQDALLEPPHYTRPAMYRGLTVPPVLRSGHFRQIDDWRDEQAWRKTQRLRPDLLKKFENSEKNTSTKPEGS